MAFYKLIETRKKVIASRMWKNSGWCMPAYQDRISVHTDWWNRSPRKSCWKKKKLWGEERVNQVAEFMFLTSNTSVPQFSLYKYYINKKYTTWIFLVWVCRINSFSFDPSTLIRPVNFDKLVFLHTTVLLFYQDFFLGSVHWAPDYIIELPR